MSETCKKGKTSEKFGTPKSGGTGFEPETSGFGVRGDNHRTITPEVRSWPRRFGVARIGAGSTELVDRSSVCNSIPPLRRRAEGFGMNGEKELKE